MSICLDMIHLPYRLIQTFSSYISSVVHVVNHKFLPFAKYLTEINFKSNFKNVSDIIYSMSSKKKKGVEIQQRPIDAIREMMEDLNLQISDLTEISKKQSEEIRSLKVKWNAKESLERDEKLKKAREAVEADKSWFWASRSSE